MKLISFLFSIQGFVGDGLYCQSVASCQINPLVCDPNANCISVQGTFVCQCRYGFIGDGHTCDPAPIYQGNDLIVSIGYALQKLNLDSNKINYIKYSTEQMAIAGIDVDCSKGQIYYTDTYGGAIMRADYIGQWVILLLFWQRCHLPEH